VFKKVTISLRHFVMLTEVASIGAGEKSAKNNFTVMGKWREIYALVNAKLAK